jgi:hypothetical protein
VNQWAHLRGIVELCHRNAAASVTVVTTFDFSIVDWLRRLKDATVAALQLLLAARKDIRLEDNYGRPNAMAVFDCGGT